MSEHLAALPLLEIIAINIVLSGDNAVVVALAVRRLPLPQRQPALLLGVGGAVLLQVLATLGVARLFQIPLLLAGGGLLLSWMAMQLLREEGGSTAQLPTATTLRRAVCTIITANSLTSLDNVLAVASIGREHPAFIACGLVVSTTLMITLSVRIAEWMNRYPFLVTVGASILAWTGGRMVATDAIVGRAVLAEFGTELKDRPWGFLLAAGMTAGVLTVGWWRRRTQGSSTAATGTAAGRAGVRRQAAIRHQSERL